MACSQQRFSSIHKSCLVITGSLLAGGGWRLGGGVVTCFVIQWQKHTYSCRLF